MRYFGPYQIVQKLGMVAYKLALPEEAKIHPVFHVSVLKLYHGSILGSIVPLSILTDAKGPLIHPEVVLQARTILRNSKSIKKLLVSWQGLPLSEASW